MAIAYYMFLGLEDALEEIAWQPDGKEIRLWNTGQTWLLFDLGTESIERYGFPYYMYHRADLHSILVDAIRELKPNAIHLRAAATGIEQDDGSVILTLSDDRTIKGNALIGADGVHSTLQNLLHGADTPKFKDLNGLARYSGCQFLTKKPLPSCWHKLGRAWRACCALFSSPR